MAHKGMKKGCCGEGSAKMPTKNVKNVRGVFSITKAVNKTTKQKGNG